MFSKCICLCHCLCLCICLCHCLFVGQVMSSHHYDQMSQRSQVSRVALWRCSLNVFVFVIVIVFVFVFAFVIVFLLVMSCPLITLIKCLKGHKSLGSLCCCVFKKLPYSLSDKVTYWAVGWTAKKLIKPSKSKRRKRRPLNKDFNRSQDYNPVIEQIMENGTGFDWLKMHKK